MPTNINVIITKETVYATYVETICYKGSFKNQQEKDEQVKTASAVAFGYAVTVGNVYVSCKEKLDFKNDQDVFKFLEIGRK